MSIADDYGNGWQAGKERAEKREWQSIGTAPKDGTKVDLWAKRWVPYNDSFIYARATDCYWSGGDSMMNQHSGWVGIDKDWHPTHWRPLPDPPEK